MNLKETREYCLNCINKPCCNNGCPLNNDIPQFIHEEDSKKAFDILCKTTIIPAICGRICPHSKQCEGVCIRGIKGEPVSIGIAESTIGDISIKENYEIPLEIDNNLTKFKVAVIGSGPAGLTCAGFLAKKGIKVTIYEKYDKLGGLLAYGIPEFRLEKKVVEDTINKILNLGIEVKYNTEFGRDIKLSELKNRYDAIFLSIGANEEKEELKGYNIISGNKLLENMNTKNQKNEIEKKVKNKKVVIYGGGNVAMDTSRTLKRMGADVTVVYRRSEKEMPAEVKEIEEAKKEKINFLFQTNIIKSDLKDRKIECVKTELIKKENEKRLSPTNIEGSNFYIEADYLILAIGSKPDNKILKDEHIEVNENGYVIVDNSYLTSINNVYAGGDLIGQKATVAWAAKSGREAAYNIIKNLQK